MGKVKKDCFYCGKEVERYPSQILGTVYCSRKCRSYYNKEKHTELFECYFCGIEKRVRKSIFNYEGNNFCSRTCKDEWQKEGLSGVNNPFFGKSHTSETKSKVSETKKSMNLVGEKAHNYRSRKVECSECGKLVKKTEYLLARSEKHFCSIRCKGNWSSVHNVGVNNPNWNPEINDKERELGRNIPKYSEFIQSVLERDLYTCVICEQKGGNLNVHHLNSYDWCVEGRTDVDNGVTLCVNCHSGFHKEHGYGRNTEEQFQEYLRSDPVKEVI